MKRAMMCVVAIAIAATAVAAQDFDKSKHPWTKWKPGAFAKFKMTTEMGEMGSQEGELTQKLKEITDKNYTTVTITSMMGMDNEDEETEEFPVKAGEEKITVDGKEYDCIIWESKGSAASRRRTPRSG